VVQTTVVQTVVVQLRFGFVSGYRFSDTASSSKSAAPSGAESETGASLSAPRPVPEKTKPTWPALLAGGVREHLRFLVSQLTLPPAPRPADILVPLEF